jgi:hypothetical protein
MVKYFLLALGFTEIAATLFVGLWALFDNIQKDTPHPVIEACNMGVIAGVLGMIGVLGVIMTGGAFITLFKLFIMFYRGV